MFTVNKCRVKEEKNNPKIFSMKRARTYRNNLMMLSMQCTAWHTIERKLGGKKMKKDEDERNFYVMFTQSAQTITWKTIEQNEQNKYKVLCVMFLNAPVQKTLRKRNDDDNEKKNKQ